MATQPDTTPTAAPLPALQEEERAREEAPVAGRRELREEKLQRALEKLNAQHEKERQALSQELRELAAGRKGVRDQLWATAVEQGEVEAASKLSREENRREDGSSSSAAALNGEEPGEGDKEKQALLKELLPAKNELHVEVQRLLEVLDRKELRKAYEHRIIKEDLREISKAHQRTRRAGLWRFVAKKKPVELGTAANQIAYVDSQLGDPKLPECYEEIKKLLDIEKNPIFSKALQEWNRKEELFSRRVERKKNRVASLKNEVYQLFGFFSVFQGVVLTAVSQSSLLYCHNKWSPISLSVLASVISTFGVLQKLKQIDELQRNVDSEERDFTTAVQVGGQLRKSELKGIDFVQLNADIESNTNRKSKLAKNSHLAKLYFVLVTLTLLAFGVLFPISFWRILCKPGAPPPAR